MAAGDEVHGELHSTDASSGVALTLYRAGSLQTVTVADNEFLDIDRASVVVADGGDAYIFLGSVGAGLQGGEIVIRGTFSENGGMTEDLSRTPRAGAAGATAVCIAPAGVVDAKITGRIRRA